MIGFEPMVLLLGANNLAMPHEGSHLDDGDNHGEEVHDNTLGWAGGAPGWGDANCIYI